jgi:hypothetical protein
MRIRRIVVALVAAMLTVANSARAQDGSADERPGSAVEVTPYVFLGSDTTSGIGAAVRFPLRAHLSLEVETNYRRAQLSPMNASLSLLFDLPAMACVTPYVAAGIGLDQYVIVDRSSAGTIVAQGKTAFAVNAGGGLRIRADENWGIRTDARWVNGLGGRAPERWRLYNGVTLTPKGR